MRKNIYIKSAILFLIITILISSVWAARNDYKSDIRVLSSYIIQAADDLNRETEKPVLDSQEIDFLIGDLKGLIQEYENILVFAESPYPGEILLARTSRANDTWHDTECSTRYDGLLKELRIRRTGSRARYLRINDIEITYVTPKGPAKQVFNQSARVRLYSDGVFNLVLSKPMKISRIKILVEHESNGLIITGVPYNIETRKPRLERASRSREVLLGTTPAGNDGWIETICDSTRRPVKEIQLKRTGRKTSYLRINNIEITHMTPTGIQKQVFNKSGRVKLYFDEVYKLVLPQPMRVTHIRISIEHESTGLQVYGVY